MAATVSYWFTVGRDLTGKRKARAGRADFQHIVLYRILLEFCFSGKKVEFWLNISYNAGCLKVITTN